MTGLQFLGFSAAVIAWLAWVFRDVRCSHKHVTWPTGGYGADKMTGKQHCLDCGAVRFLKLGEKTDWFYCEYERTVR